MHQEKFAKCEQITTRIVNFIKSFSNPQVQIIPEKLDRVWQELALELYKFQLQFNQPYNTFCKRRLSLPEDISDWRKIPAIPVAAFKEVELTVLGPQERTFVFYSSGTTQEIRSRHFHNAVSLSIYEQSISVWFKRHIIPEGADRFIFISLTPPLEQAPNSSLVYMFDYVAKEFGGIESGFYGFVDQRNAWSINYDKLLSAFYSALENNAPVIILGTAFNFVNLLDYLEANSIPIKLPDGSRVFETGGYKGRSREIPKTELYQKISSRLSIPDKFIISEYGMCELSSQAYDRVAGSTQNRLFQFPPWARSVVISPETGNPVDDGKPGLLRIYDLANVFSVMAIQTDDIAVAYNNKFQLIGRAHTAEQRGCSIMSL